MSGVRETAYGRGSALGPVTFDAGGLVPVVAQEETTGEVLLLAYMNAEALRRTLAEGVLVLWSRSRGQLWRKGEQSGHVLRVRELRVNCEGNSLLARVALEGPGACHDGYRSCYYRRLVAREDGTLAGEVSEERAFDPAAVYGDGSVTPPPTEALERDCRALYAAYKRLRDAGDTSASATARLLRAPDRAATVRRALDRAREELDELRGVLAGTHRHAGGDADVVLEAGQVGYWTTVAAVALGLPYDGWTPHAAWLAGWDGAAADVAGTGSGAAAACGALLAEAGQLCRQADVHPARVVAADLAAMRAKHGDVGREGEV
jgi:phosphoribosyl-AMP cyclohydrolase